MAFKVYEEAKLAVRALGPVVEVVARRDRGLADQLRRAGSSVLLNVAEGMQTRGGRRRQSYQVASGSAAEVRAALDVAEAWGYVDCGAVASVERHLDAVRAMLWRQAS